MHNAGFTWYAMQGMPKLDLWTWLVNEDADAPLFPFHLVVNPLGTLNFSWAFDGLDTRVPGEQGGYRHLRRGAV